MVSVTVCAVACIGLILSVLFKPTVWIKRHAVSVYWLPALAGGIFLLVGGFLPVKEAWNGLTSSGEMNPVKILSLFISMTFLSVYLDELGFFKMLANALVKRAGGAQKRLFFLLYALVAFLTVFTSNDVVVLTFTPFICCFCAEEDVSPLPYLVGEFVAANTWSMMLMIGNPTNIYLCGSAEIDFVEYLSVMWLPTLCAGVLSVGILWLCFRKTLQKPLSPRPEKSDVKDKILLGFGLVHLCGCILLLALSSYLPLTMWAICVCFALSLTLCTLFYALIKRDETALKVLGRSFKRAPWELVPFVLSMFLIVLSMERQGVTEKLCALLTGKGETFAFGFSSYLASNIVNNIPMSVLFGGILRGTAKRASVYATIAGSNLGACLTPVGALVGIMWTGLLRQHGIKFSFANFVKYGVAVSLPALFAVLSVLLLTV